MNGNLAHSPQNDNRRDNLFKQVRELGRDKTKGEDSLAKLFNALLCGSNDGFVTLDKDSDGVDDAARFYEAFIQSGQKARTYARNAESTKVQVSKLRSAVKVGAMTTCDAVVVFGTAKDLHYKAVAAGNKVRPMYQALVEIARQQLKTDRDLTDEEILECIYPAGARERTTESELKAIHHRLERLISGEAGVPFDGSEDFKATVINAEEHLRSAVAMLIEAGEKDRVLTQLRDAQDRLAALGIAA